MQPNSMEPVHLRANDGRREVQDCSKLRLDEARSTGISGTAASRSGDAGQDMELWDIEAPLHLDFAVDDRFRGSIVPNVP